MTPRGIRNNNPLNLRRTKTWWIGLCSEQKDPEFCQFLCMEYGIRAAIKNARNIIAKHHACTLANLIETWAPPSDGNNTKAYINRVCQLTGLLPTTVLNRNAKEPLLSVLQAMTIVENGQGLPAKFFDNAYSMLK